jgi:NitT/TauT family transport system substrate-binding protein
MTRRGALALATLMSVGLLTNAYAADLKKVTVRLDWLPGADHAALYLAKARGYYEAEGLDVTIEAGKGSNSTIQLVGSGNDTIGLASIATIALAVGKGVPVKAVAGIMQKAPESVYGLATSNINSPKDLEGKSFGYTPGDAAQVLFDAFAQAAGVDESKIKRVALNADSVYSALTNGNVDFTVGWVTSDAPKIAKVKPISKPILFADYGINTLGTGIFVTIRTIQDDPDMIRHFIAATVKGADDFAKDPKAGVDALMDAAPDSDRDEIANEANMLPDFLHTKNSAGHPYYWIAPEDVALTLDINKKYFGLADTVKADDVYTDEFYGAE